MRRPSARHIATISTLALLTTIPLAACGGADPIRPLPVEAAEPGGERASPSPTASAGTPAAPTTSASKPAVVRPKHTKTPRPTPTSTCLGAVRYDLDLRNTELALVRSMCFHTGGVLRLQGIGPGLVTATPTALVSPNYEGGVQDLRFIDDGTVTVTIPQDDKTYTIKVVVIR